MRTLTRGHVRAGMDSVRGAKIRSFWTMLGVVIGVTSVITVVSIGQGIKDQISTQLHSLGNNLITVSPSQLHTNSSGDSGLNLISGNGISAPLTSHDVDSVMSTKGVEASTPLSIVPGTPHSVTGNYNDGFVVGASHELPALINQSIAYGGFWGAGDEGSDVAVLGQEAANKMFNVDVPLGQSFTFHGQTFIVQGVFNEFTTTPLGQQVNFNNAIFIPNDVAESLTNSTAPTYAILARAKSDKDTNQVQKNIEKTMINNHGGRGGFEVLTGNQNLANNNDILNLLTRLIAGIAAISLLVGGLGIMNVMLVSVSERLHEIGIRKAVGATNRQIMSQFLVESTALSFGGGVVGIVLALLIDLGIRLATNLKPALSWQIIALAGGVAIVVGIIFGTIPAVKAARKDPIMALRSE
jgi:putative ABC transport system permease protein